MSLAPFGGGQTKLEIELVAADEEFQPKRFLQGLRGHLRDPTVEICEVRSTSQAIWVVVECSAHARLRLLSEFDKDEAKIAGHSIRKVSRVSSLVLAVQTAPQSERAENAWRELEERIRKRHWGWFSKKCSEPPRLDAENLYQEGLLRAWRAIGSLKRPSRFEAWVRVILTNVRRDALRKLPKARQIRLDDVGQRDLPQIRPKIDEELTVEELVAGLREEFPEVCLKIFLLRQVFGWTYIEISRKTGYSPARCRVINLRVLTRINQELGIRPGKSEETK